jgi:Spy/CpxP family protein refolding chaperone
MTLLGVFALGGVAGAGGAVAYLRHEVREFASEPRMRDRARLRGLSRMLDLTDSQREQVKSILEKHQGERQAAYSEMMERCGDSIRKQKVQMDGEILAILTPPQQEKFQAISRRQEEWFFFGPHRPR